MAWKRQDPTFYVKLGRLPPIDEARGLKLIADILGHGLLDTTAPYTQVHFEELRQAALPWPRKRA